MEIKHDKKINKVYVTLTGAEVVASAIPLLDVIWLVHKMGARGMIISDVCSFSSPICPQFQYTLSYSMSKWARFKNYIKSIFTNEELFT